jgi:transposase-like protein
MQDAKAITPQSWQTSDLIDAETGLVGKKLQGSVTVTREIRLGADRNFLEWRWSRSAKLKRFQPGAFDEFLELAEAQPESVLRYARKWGPLNGIRAGTTREPIDEWRFFSLRAGAILSLVSALKGGGFGDWDTWALIGMLEERGRTEADRTEEITRYGLPAHWVSDPVKLKERGYSKGRIVASFGGIIASELNAWIKRAGVNMEARFNGFKSPMPWEAAVTWNSRLFAALALQLVYAVSSAVLRYKCTACGKLYSRRRKPTYGRFDFCPKCGRRAAVRMAERRRREKISEARQLAAIGHSPETIAQRLNTEPATVRRWLKKKKGR